MDTIASLAHEFLSQQSIAVVGVSSSKQTVANGIVKKLTSPHRKVFAVGKNTAMFENDTCYPNLSSIPSPVQGVFIAVRQEEAERVVDECITLGVPRVWLHNVAGTGFSSASSATPRAVQKCRDNNITVIPGACPMMFCENADLGHRCIKWVLSIAGKLKA